MTGPRWRWRDQLLVLVCIGMALVTGWALFYRPLALSVGDAPAPGVKRDAGVSDIDARLDRLERLLMAGHESRSSGTKPPPLLEPKVASAQQARQAEVLQRRLEGLFASEPRASQAGAWETAVVRAFDHPDVVGAEAQPSIRDVKCRARQCRITAVFAPGADGSDWVSMMSLAMADGFGASRVVRETSPLGETLLTIYAYRNGQDDVLTQLKL